MINNRKVIFYITEDWYFVSHRLSLAAKVKEAGYDVVIATRISEHLSTIENAGLRVIPLQKMNRASLNPFKEFAALLEIISIYKKEKPDLVHQVALKPVIYGSLASMVAKTPYKVNALGGLGFAFSSKKLLARALRVVLKKTLSLLLNGVDKTLILQNSHDYSVLIENNVVDDKFVRLVKGAGVELAQYKVRPLPKGSPVIMMACRLIADKGVREYVAAARALKMKGREFRCVLVGTPDELNPTSITSKELDSWVEEGVIEWWGYQHDMPKVLSSSHLFVFPSFYGEGLPKVLIEAASCGRAIVTTDHPGCRDAILPNESGVLVPCRDVKSLIDAIDEFFIFPEKFQKMGNKGRKLAESIFDVNDIISQHIEIYEELFNHRYDKK